MTHCVYNLFYANESFDGFDKITKFLVSTENFGISHSNWISNFVFDANGSFMTALKIQNSLFPPIILGSIFHRITGLKISFFMQSFLTRLQNLKFVPSALNIGLPYLTS